MRQRYVGVGDPLSFLLAKALVLVAPLLAARELDTATYVTLEVLLTIGNWLSFGVDFGSSAGYSYWTRRPEGQSATDLHELRRWQAKVIPALVCLGAAILVLPVLLGSIGVRLLILPLAVGVFAHAQFIGARLKTHGRGNAAGWAEALPYAAVLGVAVVLLADLAGSADPLFILAAVWLAIFLVTRSLIARSGSEVHGCLERRSHYGWRSRVFLAATAGSFVTIGGRGLVSVIMVSAAQYAAFALHFRIVSVALILQRGYGTLRFADLYDASPAEFDHRTSRVSAAVLVLAAGLALPALEPLLQLAAGGAVSVISPQLLLLASLPVVAWGTSALCEMHVYRLDLAGPQSRATVVLTASAGAVIALLHWTGAALTAEHAMAGYTVLSGLYALSQLTLLWRRGNFPLPRVTALTFAATFAGVVVLVLA